MKISLQKVGLVSSGDHAYTGQVTLEFHHLGGLNRRVVSIPNDQGVQCFLKLEPPELEGHYGVCVRCDEPHTEWVIRRKERQRGRCFIVQQKVALPAGVCED